MTKEKKKDYIGSVKIKHKGLWITLLILFLLGAAAMSCVNIYLNALNIAEIGEKYLSLYVKDIKLGILCYLVAFIVSMLFFSLTSIIIKRNLLKWEETATYLTTKTRFLLLNGALSFITACALPAKLPRLIMTASNPTWFVHADPVFGKNIGYYVFQRPLFVEISKWSFYLLAALLIYSLIIYFMYYARNGAGGIKEITRQPQLICHISSIIILAYILIGCTVGLSAEYLLLDNTLTDTSGGYTDIMIWSNFFKFVPFLLCLIVVLCVVFLIKKRTKQLIFSLLTYPICWVLIAIYALGIQSFYVTPNKATIERPYIKYRIESTTQAYGLDGIEQKNYSLGGKISSQTVSSAAQYIENLILTDNQNALNMLSSLPDSKQFYMFKNADLVPVYSENSLSAKYTAAREIFIPADNKTLNEYNNRKMRYTHGFGLGSVSASSSQLPKLSEDTSLTPQPRIYFGESEKDFKKDYIITGTTIGEYDLSDQSAESTYSYDGPAGVKLSSLNRILYAFRYQDPSILFSGNITENSKILFNRNVIERAKIAIPFLTYDEDPYLVETSDGSLKWILDGYTATNNYPYAVKLFNLDKDFGTNYVRNSVKLTVDAYTGEINAYIIDWDDPIIRTLSNIYPEVFTSGLLPEEISSHIKYPKTLFEMQSGIYKTYHDTNPAEFYTGENAWEYAMSKSGENSTVKSFSPYYQFLSIDAGVRELALISAFTPVGNSDILTSFLTVSSGKENYGKLSLYTFPKNAHVFGTIKVESRIESDKTVADELELLKAEGNICFGPLTPLPVLDTICYIKPVYVNDGTLKLKRVIAVCGESVVIDMNLPAAFKKLAALTPKSDYTFAPADGKPQTEQPDTSAEYNPLVISALDKYSEAKLFQSEGDWVNYGKAMDEFESLLEQIRYEITYPSEEE